MESTYSSLAYIIIAIICCISLIWRAKSRYFVGLCIIWLFSIPILDNSDYSITIPFVDFNLSAGRLLLFGMLPLIVVFVKDRVKTFSFSRANRLEIFLVFYFLILVIVQFINFQEIQTNIFLNNLAAALNFLFIFFLAKWQINEKDFKIIKQAFLLFSILSAIVGIIQFTVDPFFLRFGANRLAFGDLLRSNGLTSAEYNQGMMMAIALVITYDLYKNNLVKIGFFCLSATGAFFTMHRLTWVVFSMVAVGIILFQLRRHIRLLFWGFACVSLIGIAIFVNFGYDINKSIANTEFSQRLFADTLSGREDYYVNVPKLVIADPLGIAAYSNPIYNRWAIQNGIISANKLATVIHNGFLATLVKFGVFGLIGFVMFYFYVVRFGLNLITTNLKTGILLILICLVYLGYNITNDFSLSPGNYLPTIINLFLGCIISLENKNLRQF
jgi:hypothetical protein